MKNIKLWKNRKAIKWYATLAIVFITVFQGYWLYTVYQSKKEILLKESENILKKAVLDFDTKAIQNQILSTAGGASEMDDITRMLLDAVKNNKNSSVKVTVEGEEFNDSISRQMMGNLTKKGVAVKSDKSKKIYAIIKAEMLTIFGEIKFAVYHYNKEAVDHFPQKKLEQETITDQVRSEIDSKQYYEIHFEKLHSVIIREMLLSILLSLIYLITCGTAVILLIFNVDKSRKLMLQKDNFTNNMTHEFKTPMATIHAAIEALDTYNVLDDKEMAKEYLAMMKTDLNRLISMTDSILFNAKMSDGALSLNFEKINLLSFTENIIENLKHILEKKQAFVTIESDDASIAILADTEHFGNVFRNLIDNSIKYSKENAIINIRISNDETFAKILFSDEGIGIPQKYKNEIFKPYFRVQENDVYTVKGYGLGLSYIQQIILLHSGKIALSAKETKGTTFEILIPKNHD